MNQPIGAGKAKAVEFSGERVWWLKHDGPFDKTSRLGLHRQLASSLLPGERAKSLLYKRGRLPGQLPFLVMRVIATCHKVSRDEPATETSRPERLKPIKRSPLLGYGVFVSQIQE